MSGLDTGLDAADASAEDFSLVSDRDVVPAVRPIGQYASSPPLNAVGPTTSAPPPPLHL